jgi:mono/diheme cytochrome c family protein
MDPGSVNSKASMPKLGITSEEADKLIVFLDWISKVDTNGWPPKPILASAAGAAVKELSKGQQLYQSLGCSACHMISGIGGTTGPDLTRLGVRQPDAEWHVKHLKDPRSLVPNSAMPPYANVPDQDLKELANYLVGLK